MSKFLHHADDHDDPKATAIPLVFSKNSRAKRMPFESSSLIVWTALWIVNTYSEFQENIFSNNRDITKCQFLPRQCQGYTNTSGFLRN